MNTFLKLIVIVAAAVFIANNFQGIGRLLGVAETPTEAPAPTPLPKAANDPKPQIAKPSTSRYVGKGPRFNFGGRITQHVAGGVLVHCDEYLTALPPGYDFSAINGDFLLVGHPTAESMPDDARLAFQAQHAGMYAYNTVAGANRTIIALAYAAPDLTPAATPKPGDWMFKKSNRGALDQPAR